MESVRECDKKLWEMICKCVQYSVQALRAGAEKLWDMICSCTEKLCEIIGKCVKTSVQGFRALSQETGELIHAFVYPCVKAIHSVVDGASCFVKPFYDNLSEILKDSMTRAKKKVDEIWEFISQMLSSWKNSCEAAPNKSFSYLIQFFEHVKSFISMAKEATEKTRNRYKWYQNENDYPLFLIKLLMKAKCKIATLLAIECEKDSLPFHKLLKILLNEPTELILDIIIEIIRFFSSSD